MFKLSQPSSEKESHTLRIELCSYEIVIEILLNEIRK